MALAVDTAGKVKADPTTGKVGGGLLPETGGGASALRDAVGGNALPAKRDRGNTLADTLANVLGQAGNVMSEKASSASSRLGQADSRNGTASTKRNVSHGQASYDIPSMSPLQAPATISSGLADTNDSPRITLSSGDVSDVRSGYEDARRERARTNDVYEQDMVRNGMPASYIDKVLKEDDAVTAAIDSANELDPEWRKDLLNQLTTSVDDGSMDRQHLLSDWMTGKQYYHYVHDLGMRGMPEKEIDVSDDARYSKSEQQMLYGFTPYVPNDTTYLLGKLFGPDLKAASRIASDYISNLRTNGFLNDVDYLIGADTGYGNHEFSGSDFDRATNGYLSQFNDLYDKAYGGDPDAILALTSKPVGDEPYTTMVHEWELPDGSLHYGVITDESRYFDLDQEGVNDLLWSDLINGTPQSQVLDDDGNPTGLVTQGNITYAIGDDGILVPLSVLSKDGYLLNLETSDNGTISLKDDESTKEWYDQHDVIHVSFSDGSSASIPTSEAIGLMNGNDDEFIKDNRWVPYGDTDLSTVNGFDTDTLTVGSPTSLNDYYDFVNGSGSQAGVLYEPDMVLPDGTRISHDAALKIAKDDNPNDSDDDGISYSFEKSGLNPGRINAISGLVGSLVDPFLSFTDSRPRRLMHDEPIDEEGIHLDDIVNNMTDWAAGSLPISLPYYQWVDALSKADPYIVGVEGAGRDSGGRYTSTGYDLGSEENTMKAATTLIGPYTENLAGKYGHEGWLDPTVERLLKSRFGEDTFRYLLANQAWDSVGEGIEEVIGNYLEEFGTYGLKNAWANPVDVLQPGMGDIYDKDHNFLFSMPDDASPLPVTDVMYDENGREIRNPDTPFLDRLANAVAPTPEHLRETANAAIGGAGVSWLYGFPELAYGALGSGLKMLNDRRDNANQLEDDDVRSGIGSDAPNGRHPVPTDIKVPESLRNDRIAYNPDDYIIPRNAPIR